MKQRLLLLALASLILVGCEASTEKKIEKLINTEVKKSLLLPETYDPVETVIDSAFSPWDSPEFLENMVKASKLGSEMNWLETEIKDAITTMAMYEDIINMGYCNSYDRINYENAKSEYEDALSKQTELKNNVWNLFDEMQEIIGNGKEFVGYKVYHKYRMKYNDGETNMAADVFIINKEVTKVIAEYDNDTYKGIQMGIEMLLNKTFQ